MRREREVDRGVAPPPAGVHGRHEDALAGSVDEAELALVVDDLRDPLRVHLDEVDVVGHASPPCGALKGTVSPRVRRRLRRS